MDSRISTGIRILWNNRDCRFNWRNDDDVFCPEKRQ